MDSGKIYRLESDSGHFYYGSTTKSLKERLGVHRRYSIKGESRVYRFIREHGKDKMRITLVLDYPCETKEQLRQKEDEYIRPQLTNPLCLNERLAFLTEEEALTYDKEYYSKHKESILAQNKTYYEENKDAKCAYQKAYYQKHKEELCAYQKTYNQKHKEELCAYQKTYNLRRETEANRLVYKNV